MAQAVFDSNSKQNQEVPRGMQGDKSSKNMASSRNLVSAIGAQASPKKGGEEQGVRKGKRSLLASHTRCKCFMETTHNSVKVKLGHEIGGKSDRLGSNCWSRVRMSLNIRERVTSDCSIRSPYRP